MAISLALTAALTSVLAAGKGYDIWEAAKYRRKAKRKKHKMMAYYAQLAEKLFKEQSPELQEAYRGAREKLVSRGAATGAIRGGMTPRELAKLFAREGTARQRLKAEWRRWGEQMGQAYEPTVPKATDLFGTVLGAALLAHEFGAFGKSIPKAPSFARGGTYAGYSPLKQKALGQALGIQSMLRSPYGY